MGLAPFCVIDAPGVYVASKSKIMVDEKSIIEGPWPARSCYRFFLSAGQSYSLSSGPSFANTKP